MNVRVADEVRRALRAVDDPEFPGVSISDLGIVESVAVSSDGVASIELVPTYGGCPALDMIAASAHAAAAAVEGVRAVDVSWRRDVAWSAARISASARLALARDFAVAVRVGRERVSCPVCGVDTVTPRSAIGPTRCRSISWCAACRNPIEVFGTGSPGAAHP